MLSNTNYITILVISLSSALAFTMSISRHRRGLFRLICKVDRKKPRRVELVEKRSSSDFF